MTDCAVPEAALCWELGVVQQPKQGETVCGDRIAVFRENDRLRLVLSDGLGSGIQAGIASTLTATLLAGLTERGVSLEDAVRSASAVLPTTKKHGLAYATFTLVSAEGRTLHLVQYDNPMALFLRDGVSLPYPYRERSVSDKTLLESALNAKCGDMLILFSDGVSEAGRGLTTYAGWDRREMEDYLLRSVRPDDDARRVAASIVSAVQALDLFSFHDDTTVAVLRLRERLSVTLAVGRCGGCSADLTLEDGAALEELLELLSRYSENGLMSLDGEPGADAASRALDLLATQASDVKILFCPSPGAPERPEDALRLRRLLEELGKTVTLRFC